jgi:AcrR family transcriptional regulator
MAVGRPARIDRDAVLRSGLALADELGLASVTMQAVAGRLGVTPMALYRHVGSKAELLDGLVERLLTEFPMPSPGLPWDERLTAVAQGIRRVARRHPAVFPLLLERPAATPVALRVRGGVYDALADAGVEPDEIARTERLVSTAILGFAVSEVAGRFSRHSRRLLDGDFTRLLELLRACIVGPSAPSPATP